MIQLPKDSNGNVSLTTIGLIVATVIFVVITGYLMYSFIGSNARDGVASEYRRNFFKQSATTTIPTEVEQSLFVEGEARITLRRDGVRDLTNNVELLYSTPMTGRSHLMKFFPSPDTVGCEPYELIVSEYEPATAICGNTEYTLEVINYTSRNQTITVALTATSSDTFIPPPSALTEAEAETGTSTSSSSASTSTNEQSTSSSADRLSFEVSTSSVGTTTTQLSPTTTASGTSSVSTGDGCETKECLSNHLSTCEPVSTSEPIEDLGTLAAYDILGRSDVGACQVKIVYQQHPQPSWIGKPLTCNFDTDLDIDAALHHALESALTNNLAECSGSLYSDVLENL